MQGETLKWTYISDSCNLGDEEGGGEGSRVAVAPAVGVVDLLGGEDEVEADLGEIEPEAGEAARLPRSPALALRRGATWSDLDVNYHQTNPPDSPPEINCFFV